jgi:HlyD family secretion protein
MIEDTSTMDRPVARRATLRRTLPWAVPTALALALVVPAAPLVKRWLAAERSVPLSRLRIATVVRGDLERDVAVQGRVVAAFHPTSFSPAAGIVALAVRPGEAVDRGQVMARIDSPQLASRLEQERATLASLETALGRERIRVKQAELTRRQEVDLATVALEAAERAMARAQRSREEGILDAVGFERAQDDLRRAELELAHATENAGLDGETLEFELRNREHELERQRLVVADVRRQLDELVVRALVAGQVARLDAEDRDAVTPGQPLVTVVDLSRFELEVSIPEAYAGEIGPGTPAVVQHGGREWAAEIESVSPEVEGSQVLAVVAFVERAPEGLRQNQRLPTRLVLDSRKDVLKVARGPFVEATGGGRAWVVSGDVAELRPIRLGAISVSEVEVLEGLEEGDRIIISDAAGFGDAERLYLRR